ncbi:MAG: glycoside hydrolase family 3 N-terminal domain-containing protein, partial [Myxococcota bacterium]
MSTTTFHGGFVRTGTSLAWILPLLLGGIGSPSHAGKIDDLLAKMTPEEKIGQLSQYAGSIGENGPSSIDDKYREMVRRGAVGSFLSAHGATLLREWQRLAVEESRLGIPLLFAFDVIHGFRTTFPIPLAEVASWDPEAVEKGARIAAVEAAAAGLHWTFAPMVDIARDPRWGRIAEGAGEDPYMGSIMAAARVRGFQGKSLRDADALLACAKHFVAYGGAEGGRDYNTVDISERTLRELYLPPFRAALDAGAATVMSAFNEIGGVPMTGNEPLLRGLLRRAWGFDGVVVSDWESVRELMAHGVAGATAEAATLGLAAGVDIDMVSGLYAAEAIGLVRQGLISQATVDAAVRRVLRAKEALGLFDDPYRSFDPERERRVTLAPEHRAVARDVARRSIVLLKNDGQTLPLTKTLRRVAVIG